MLNCGCGDTERRLRHMGAEPLHGLDLYGKPPRRAAVSDMVAIIS